MSRRQRAASAVVKRAQRQSVPLQWITKFSPRAPADHALSAPTIVAFE